MYFFCLLVRPPYMLKSFKIHFNLNEIWKYLLFVLLHILYCVLFDMPVCTLLPPPCCLQANPVFYRYVLLLSAGLIAIFGSAEVGLSGAGPLGCLNTATVAAHMWRKQRHTGEPVRWQILRKWKIALNMCCFSNINDQFINCFPVLLSGFYSLKCRSYFYTRIKNDNQSIIMMHMYVRKGFIWSFYYSDLIKNRKCFY